jgi:hypothetical protein
MTTDKNSPLVSLHSSSESPLARVRASTHESKSFLFSSDSLHQSIATPDGSRIGICGSGCASIAPGYAFIALGLVEPEILQWWPFTSTGWPKTTTPPGIVLVAQGEPLHGAPIRASTALRDPGLLQGNYLRLHDWPPKLMGETLQLPT